MPSTYQLFRRPPHLKKCTRTANCFIDCHLSTGSTFTRGHCLLEPNEGAWLKEITEGALGNWTAAEWNQVVFSDEFRFNLRSDDNRVRVWRPRGEHLNLAFALQ
ncbi:transposable element Tcb2 transposase [Trichonephila clavipes]|nr:transposable element Tcb2 transposase [Trichonephila clavipes]